MRAGQQTHAHTEARNEREEGNERWVERKSERQEVREWELRREGMNVRRVEGTSQVQGTHEASE